MTSKLREVSLEATAAPGEERPERDQVQKPTATSGPEAAAARPAAVKRHPKQKPDLPDEDLDARLNTLRDAANAASAHARNVYVTFLLFGLYLAIIFGSTTHEQLLRESPVTLPLLNVGLPLVGFYWIAPALFVLLHLNLLLQLILLAGKLHRLNEAIAKIGDEERQRDERSKLFPFPFTQMLAGWTGHGLTHWLVTFVVWTTVVVLPILVLLFGQLRFLPYHSWETVCWHRFLLFVDLAALWLLWSRTIDPSGAVAHRLPATAAESRRTFDRLLDLDAWPSMIRTASRQRRDIDARVLGLRGLTLVAASLGMFVIAIPGTPTARLIDGFFGERARLIVFARNLELRETDLVASQPDAAFVEAHGEEVTLKYTRGLDLRRRDLRYVDLSSTALRRADLRGADLKGAILTDANLQGVNLTSANLQDAGFQLDDVEQVLLLAKGCGLRDVLLNLRGADVRDGVLRRAVLPCTDLQGATLEDVDLRSAVLVDSNLKGVNLSRANLQGANLSNANLQGAVLLSVNLQGADLTAATLQGAQLGFAELGGADLGNTDLQGADLRSARFQGANLGNANFQAADLRGANLQGAALQFANLEGADLRGAHLWRGLVDEQPELVERWRLADMREVSVEPMGEVESFIDGVLREIDVEDAREPVRQRLREGLIGHRRHERPQLPSALASAILFDPGSALAEDRGWGEPMSIADYDRHLAAEVLIPVACAPDAPPGIASNIAVRALNEPQAGRLYPGLIAKTLLSHDCPPAKELHEDLGIGLREILWKQ